MTASRTWRSRSFRDATMSPKLLPTNNLDPSPRAGQVADEGVETEPALGRAHQPLLPDLRPSLLHPMGGRGRQRAVKGGKRQPPIGPQGEIKALQLKLLLGQDLRGLDRRQSGDDGAPIRLPPGQIPATDAAVERMCRGTEPPIGATGPVRRVVARTVTVALGVRDFVEPIAASRKA